MSQPQPERVLVYAPFGRDAALICQVLARSGIGADICPTVDALLSAIGESTGAALVSDQSLTRADVSALTAVLSKQPPWSDIPLIVTTSGGDLTEARRRHLEILEPLGNVSLLERPLRAVTLVSAVQTALRARRRQYQLRENFAERERLVRELERSNEELAEFAHVVSHDLQAPIRMVSSFSALLARRHKGQLGVEADQLIDTIQAGAAAMEALVRTLLNYATVGQASLTPDNVSLLSVVDTVITTLRPAIEEVRAKVSYGDLPAVWGDRVLLQELVQNLVGNALKYRDPKVIPCISITSEQNGDEWIVSVKDNGPGIPPEYQARIFVPLKRLHGREIPGTGMGLAVCRKIVERHGGRIWVESETGNGSTFYFSLPTLKAQQKATTADLAR